MTKFFRWIFYFIASIALALVVLFSVAYWNRDVILKRITAQLNKGINGEFKIQKLDFTLLNDFPNFSLTLKNVSLRGPRFDVYRHNFLVANKIFVDINLYQLLKKTINVRSLKVESADVFIFKGKDGYANWNLFKKDSVSTADSSAQTENPFLLSVRNMEFKDVHVVYSDSLKNKSYSFWFIHTRHEVKATDSTYETHVNGKIHFDSLVFKKGNGSFLTNKSGRGDFYVNINRLTKRLTIAPSSLLVTKARIHFSGFFQMEPEGGFGLKLETEKINLEDGISLLDNHLRKSLRRFRVDQPIDVSVSLKGKMIPFNRPAVDVQFGSSNASVNFNKLHFRKLSFTGTFTNHADTTKVFDNANSQIAISTFEGIMNSFPVKGSATVSELQNPFLKLDVLTEMKLADLNNHIDSVRFGFGAGTISTRIKYEGRLSEYVDSARTTYEGKLKGITYVKDGEFHYNPRKLKLKRINAVFEFDKDRLKIDSVAFHLNESPVLIKGVAQNFVPFFIQPKNKGYFKVEVYSPRLDLTPFSEKRAGYKTNRQKRQEKKQVSDLMDGIFEKLEFDLNVKADELILRKFKATNVSGKITLSHQALEAKPVTMNVAGGTMNVNFRLSDLSKNINPMVVSAKVNNARIKDFFINFDNFNQKTISHHNLAGTISANAKFNAKMDDNLKILAPSMKGDIEVKIKNGHLIDFEPMLNMSNFLFKKRDFTDIEFAEIDSHFFLAGSDMDISRMEIESSVLSFFVHGRYSFTDSTSLSVQLPLSNLKKRDKNYKPKNVGVDAKVGPSIFLHIYKDEEGKIAIAYDPFKKYVKQ
jgi:hypothetical protein